MIFIYHVSPFLPLYSIMAKENLVQMFINRQCLLTGKVTGLPVMQFTVCCARLQNSFKEILNSVISAAVSKHQVGRIACRTGLE